MSEKKKDTRIPLEETFTPVGEMELVEGQLDEATGKKGPSRVKLKFGKVDFINQNGRYYSRKLMEPRIAKLQEAINRGSLMMEGDHPEPLRDSTGKPIKNAKATIDKTAGVITELKIEKDGWITGWANIVEEYPGTKVKAIINAGGRPDVSQRGFGSVIVDIIEDKQTKEKKKAQIVQEDYVLKSFDFVVGGSVKTAGVEEFLETKNGGEVEDMAEKLEIKDLKEFKTDFPKLYDAMRKDVAEELEHEVANFKKQIKEQEEVVEARVREELANEMAEAEELSEGSKAKLEMISAILSGDYTVDESASDDPAVKTQKKSKAEEKLEQVVSELKTALQDLTEQVEGNSNKFTASEKATYLAEQLNGEAYSKNIMKMIPESATTKEQLDEALKTARADVTDLLETAKTTPKGMGKNLPGELNEQTGDKAKARQAYLAGI